jgi:hypothetical protein
LPIMFSLQLSFRLNIFNTVYIGPASDNSRPERALFKNF